ncbi:MAG: aldo/keto reductase [Bryobacteraceae bacterium]|nr:aldo/keto reductase [Bryobacteraceae bacterium]
MACKKSRRDFLRLAGAAGAAAVVGGGAALPAAAAAKRSATDWVTLGNSGVKVTRLAFGTGTFGGRVQRELGQKEFTKLVRYAYDRGIRFFESADAYNEMHEMLAEALKGVPRDTYKLMTKYRLRETADPKDTIDRYRKELNSEYFDILLLHCVRTHDWPERFKSLQDTFSDAKAKKVILSHGASVHGLLPLRQFPTMTKWLDVALMRVNHDGTKMDNIESETDQKGDVPEVVSHIQTVRKAGVGVLGMKLIGEGQFKDAAQRDASIKYVMKLGTVDAVTIGFKSMAEIDEAIERINTHLNS